MLMVKHSSIYGLLALGMTLVIITGGIDLSVGAVVGLSGMIAGGLMIEGIRLPWIAGTIYPNVPLILLVVFVLAIIIGLFSGFLIIMTSQLRAAHPATGESWEMNAIASVVLGGTSMSGGLGTIGGTIVGILVINVLNDGMIMMGVSSFWQMVIKGIVIIVAVVIDLVQKDLQKKAALAARSK